MQFCFMLGKTTMDAIFIVCQLEILGKGERSLDGFSRFGEWF
jgi:hypothetical protein